MNKSGFLERVIAWCVLALVGACLAYVYTYVYQKNQGIVFKAEFDAVGGLAIGGPVKINGAVVGVVRDIALNPEKNFNVVVSFSVQKDIDVPEDSEVSIVNETLLGQPVLILVPGVQDKPMVSGGVFYRTTSPLNMNELIERMLFHKNEEPASKEEEKEGVSLDAGHAPCSPCSAS
jgi:ABC-type transporter Mla subunit MlaD